MEVSGLKLGLEIAAMLIGAICIVFFVYLRLLSKKRE